MAQIQISSEDVMAYSKQVDAYAMRFELYLTKLNPECIMWNLFGNLQLRNTLWNNFKR